MIDKISTIARGLVQFYAWTVGGGLVLLALVMLWQGAIDLVREWASATRSRGRGNHLSGATADRSPAPVGVPATVGRADWSNRSDPADSQAFAIPARIA